MDKRQQKLVIESINAFNKKLDDRKTPVERAAEMLGYRKIARAELDAIDARLTEFRNIPFTKVRDDYFYKKGSLKNSHIRASFTTMLPIEGRTGEGLDISKFAPMTTFCEVRQDFLSYFYRFYPFLFNPDHTEFRFFQRTSNMLDYGSDDFRFSLAAGLLLNEVAGEEMDDKRKFKLMVIPHPKGLFLGSAHQYDGVFCSLGHSTYVHRRERETVSIGYFNDGPDKDIYAPYTPQSVSHLNTFIGVGDFRQDQRRLHRALSKIFEEHCCTINMYFNAYSDPDYFYEDTFEAMPDKIGAVKEKIREIVVSPEWSIAEHKSEKHLRVQQRQFYRVLADHGLDVPSVS